MQVTRYSLKHPWRTRLLLQKGVLRRLLLILFRRRYVLQQLTRRQGECRRCGACCCLVARHCSFLQTDREGTGTGCRLYKYYRLPNCSYFPIDERDLKERDLIAPDTPCGYFWPPEA